MTSCQGFEMLQNTSVTFIEAIYDKNGCYFVVLFHYLTLFAFLFAIW